MFWSVWVERNRKFLCKTHYVSWPQTVCKHSLIVHVIQRNVPAECCHPLSAPWCHSSSSRAVPLANGSHEITSKQLWSPTENCLLMETGSEWHIYTTFTHPGLRSPTCTLTCRSTESRLSTPPADITSFMKCTLFYTGEGLVWIGPSCMRRAGLKVILLKGRKPGAVTKRM